MQRYSIFLISKAFVILVYIGLIVLSPSILFIDFIEAHDAQRVLQLGLLSLVLLDAILIYLTKTGTLQLNSKIRLAFFALLTLSVISAANSIAPRYATIEITIFTALCYLALFTARLYQEKGEQFAKLLTYAICASIIMYLVSFYTGYISALAFGKVLKWPAPFYGFSNIREFQEYQLWTIGLICLPLLTLDIKRSKQILIYLTLAFWWVLLFYAASRGVILAWLVAVIVTAILYKKQAWPFLRIQLINATTGLCAYLVLFKTIPAWIASTNIATTSTTTSTIITSTIFRETTHDRLDLWKAAYVMIKNFPLFGVGPMHFYFYTPHGTHPHNSVLQLASEFGLPFTLITLFIVGYSFYHWMRNFNVKQLQTETKQNISLTIVLFFTIISGIAYSLVEGVIVMPISQVLMVTVIGLMIGQYAQKSWAKNSINTSTKSNLTGSIFAIIVLLLMTLSTMPELAKGLTSKSRVLKNNERAFSMRPDSINPRIWMQQRRIEPTKK
jgi:O-antigen ligase